MDLKKLLKTKISQYSFLILKSLVISAIIVATFSKIPIPKAQTSEPLPGAWMNENWLYRKSITVSNTQGTLTDEDVLVSIDTSTLISESKLQNNCEDLRFTDGDGTTSLDYWIEDGCNTNSTKVWVKVPSLASGDSYIYVYYGNNIATSASLTWNGDIYMYADTTCPTGWTQASSLNGKFLYGSDTVGNTGGSSTSSHSDVSCTSSSISTTSVSGSTTSGNTGTTTTHTHTGLSAALNSATSLPPYEDMILCYNNDFLISQGLISTFIESPTASWTRFSALDDIFPRSNSSYGTTGGSNTHTHTGVTGNVTGTETGQLTTISTPFSATGGTVTYSGGYTIHTFTSSGTFTVAQGGSVEILVIGGGGGGGYNSSYDKWGGGGAGGYIYNSSYSFAAGSYTVTIGAGGAINNNGGDTTVSTLTAVGGGHGAHRTLEAAAGGSGGGGANTTHPTGAAGTTGQGNSGGTTSGGNNAGSGGGGAGGVGSNGGTAAGAGGAGTTSSISGSSVCYAGGGGGEYNNDYASATCGGGSGAAATANTGGGGSARYAGGSGIVIIRYSTITLSGAIAAASHTHTISNAVISSASNLPPYMTLLFEKANTDSYVDSSNIIATSEIPPLGWTRYTELDNKFVMGSTIAGSTGGASSHTHTVTLSTGAPSATTNAYGSGESLADSTHTHSCATTTDSSSNIPPYYSILYMQRETSLENIVNTEETQNTQPNPPDALLAEDLYNPTSLITSTPTLSALYTDTDTNDTARYYEIQVNTDADFTGTEMWDTGQTAIDTPLDNEQRLPDVTYAGSTLEEGKTYYWRMKFWDNGTINNESEWSETYNFTLDSTPTSQIIDASGDIYAGKELDIQTVYSDGDGSTDITYVYLRINNSSGTNLELYAASTGFAQTAQTPITILGASYIQSASYDLVMDSPTSNDITVTWHLTLTWDWARSNTLAYQTKTTDLHGAECSYTSDSHSYSYENRLALVGSTLLQDDDSNTLSSSTWYPSNMTVKVSGIKAVYYGTTDEYPSPNDYDIQITNEESTTWTSDPTLGSEISMNIATPNVTNAEDTYNISITDIPTGGSDSSNTSFNLKTDSTVPVFSTFTSSLNPNQTTWYNSRDINLTWTITDANSGIYKVWYLLDQNFSTTASTIKATGTESATSYTYSKTLSQDGTWYVHVLAEDNVGLTTLQTYTFKVDTINPTITSISSTSHPSQSIWYTNKNILLSWQTSDAGSGIQGTWILASKNSTETATTILTNGTSKADSTFSTITVSTDGTWYIHLLTKDYSGKTSYAQYTVNIDSTTPNIVAVNGENNGIWQNTNNGPIISWTNPNSLSGNTFYITNNGTTPSATNYTYRTTNVSYDLPAQNEGETIIKVRAINGAGAYSEIRSYTLRYDITAPNNVTNLYATATESSVRLSWTNPTNSDLNKITIIRNQDHIPTSLSDGDNIYSGTATYYSDTNLSKDTIYYYSVFASDKAGNTSTGSVAKVVTSEGQETTTPTTTDDTKVVKVQDLSSTEKVKFTSPTQTISTTSTGEVHVFTNQTIDVKIPSSTIQSNTTTDPELIVLVLGSNVYTMDYNSDSKMYETSVSAPEVKGTYDMNIQAISDDTSTLTITMSLLVDPYGYIYAQNMGNQLRIANATVTLYKMENGVESEWSSNDESTNPQTTNDSGEYQFFVEAGVYKLVVQADGYNTVATDWFTVENNIIEKNILVTRSYKQYIIPGAIILGSIVIGGIILIIIKKKNSKK